MFVRTAPTHRPGPQERGSAGHELQDRRPEAAAQRELVELTRRGARSGDAAALSDRIAASTRSAGQGTRGAIVQRKADGDTAAVSAPASRPNRTGLPDALKSGVEALSGLRMDDVRVHYDSREPARLRALAFTRGTEIHIGPGQERHLPHEAWHVVQQARGGVSAERQLKSGHGLNEDHRLEREADVMGDRASRLGSFQVCELQPLGQVVPVTQMVRGGVEFTEDLPALFRSYPTPGVGAAAVNRAEQWDIEGATVSAFLRPNPPAGQRNTDHRLLQSGQVSLTNDVESAEWVIARHGADLDARDMYDALDADLGQMFRMITALSTAVTTLAAANAGQTVVLAPGNVATLHTAPAGTGVFVYRPGTAASKGKAQVTFQYTSLDTVRRINKLNASKFITGTKVAVGEDADRVAGTESQALRTADTEGSTSFSRAGVLLDQLVASSNAIAGALTAAQVGLVKLMVINDALATTMVSYNARLGQAQEKNLQRFFPKSRRNEYVRLVAGANVSDANMLLLRAEINRTAAADALLFYNRADPGALRTDEAFHALAAADARRDGMIAAQQAMRLGTVDGTHVAGMGHIKEVVLGANGATLATWIGHAANAYTDNDAGAVDHERNVAAPMAAPQMVGNVIRSTAGYTPVAGGGRGAVYEFREREISAEQDGFILSGRSELLAAIWTLIGAV